MTSRRRSAASGVAAIALAAGLVLAGSSAAQADAVIDITSPGDGVTLIWSSTVPVQISGTTIDTDPTHLIDIWDASSGGSPDPMCLGIDPSSGTWLCEWPLSPGTKEILASQNGFANSDVVEFTILPPAPTTSQPVYDVPYATPLAIGGGLDWPGGTVTATVEGQPLACTDPAPGTGWGCSLDFDAGPTPPGTYTVHVQQDLGGGITSPVADATVNIGGPAPTEVTIDYPGDDEHITWQGGPNVPVSGRAPLGQPVDVSFDGVPVPACQGLMPDFNAQWACGSISGDVGPHTVAATQGAVTDSVDFHLLAPAPEVGGQPLSAEIDDPDFAVGGTFALDGFTVHVRVDVGGGFVECTDESPFPGGAWSCDLDLIEVPEGTYPVYVWQEPEPADPLVEWDTATLSLQIYVPPPPPAPNLSCSYSPGGGFATSSPWAMDAYAVYRVYYEFGSSGSSDFGFPGSCNGSPGSPRPGEPDLLFDLVQNCDPTCSIPGLDPGLYEVYYMVEDGAPGAPSFEQHSYLFTIPTAPVITQTASTTSSVILRGTAGAGELIRIARPNGSTMCSTTANGSGIWACQFPKSATASARAIAIDTASGGMSAYSASRAIPVATEPAAPETFLINWFVEFGSDLMTLKPGDRFTITIDGMPEGTEIEIWMHSTPRLLGSATSTGGQTAIDLVVPLDIEGGAHEIEMIATTLGGESFTYSSEALVTVDPKTFVEEDREGTADDDDGAAGAGGGSADRGDAAAPSYITGSLPTVGLILANPVALAVAVGLAIALLFLVALPSELLNNSLSSNTSRLGRVYGAIDRAFSRARDWLIRVTRSRAVAAALIVAIVALVYGFVDPEFGFDLVSLRLVLSLGIAFFLLSYGGAWLSGLVMRRAWGVSNVVVMQPSIILFAIVGVIVARLVEFSPGFLVGIGIGLELIAASKRVSARAVLVQFGFVVGLATLAWIAYSLFVPGNDFFGMLVSDTFAAITAEGLMGALVAVFPLRFLEGRKVWEVSKPAWVAAFLVVATAFALLVLPTAAVGTDVSDYGVWIAVFAGFGLLAVAVWFFFARAERKEELAATPKRAKVDA